MADAIKKCFIYYLYYDADQFQNNVFIFKRNPSNQGLDAEAYNLLVLHDSVYFSYVLCCIEMRSLKSDTKKKKKKKKKYVLS